MTSVPGRSRACPVGHDCVVCDGRMTLRDGRTLAWREYGPPGGRPILRFQGTPGSRYSRHPHEDSYVRLGARTVVFDQHDEILAELLAR